MKNNVTYLYNRTNNISTETYHKKADRSWLFAITDSIITQTISVCTIFCIYLAYMML